MEAAGGRPYIIVPKTLLAQLKGIPGGINIVVRKIISSYKLVANYDPRTDNLAIIGQNEDILQLAIHSLRLWVDKERAKKKKLIKSGQVPSDKDDVECADTEFDCYLNNLKVNWAFYGDFAKKVCHLLAPELEELKHSDGSVLFRHTPSAEKPNELEIGCAFEIYPQIKDKIEALIEKARRLYKDDNFFIPKSDEVKANAFIDKKKDNKDILYILTEEYEPEPRIRMTIYGRSGGHVATARLDWIEVAGPGLPGSNLVEGYLSGKTPMDKGTQSGSKFYSIRSVNKTAKPINSLLTSGNRNSVELPVHFEKTRIDQGTKDNLIKTNIDGKPIENKTDAHKEKADADEKTKNDTMTTTSVGKTIETKSDTLKENASAEKKAKRDMKNINTGAKVIEKKINGFKEKITVTENSKTNGKKTMTDRNITEKNNETLNENSAAEEKTEKNKTNSKDGTILDDKRTYKSSYGIVQETGTKKNGKTIKAEETFNKQKLHIPKSGTHGGQKGHDGINQYLPKRMRIETPNGIEKVDINERKRNRLSKMGEDTGHDNTIKQRPVIISDPEKIVGGTVKKITKSRPISMEGLRNKTKKKIGQYAVENSETKSNPEIEFTSKGYEQHAVERKELSQTKKEWNDFKGRFELRSDAEDTDHLYKRTFDTIYKYKDFKYSPSETSHTRREKYKQKQDVINSSKYFSFAADQQNTNRSGERGRKRYRINLDEVGNSTNAHHQEKSESDRADSTKIKQHSQSKESGKESFKLKEPSEVKEIDKGEDNKDDVKNINVKAAQGPKKENTEGNGEIPKKKSIENRTRVSKDIETKGDAKQNTRKKYDPWLAKKEKEHIEQKKLETIMSQPKREDKLETGLQLRITEAIERQQEILLSHREVKPREILKLTGEKHAQTVANETLFSNAPPCNEYLDSQFRYSFTRNGLRVFIYQFFIIEHKSVDLIVNDTDERLKHYNGLAAQIAKAAGSQLEQDCRVVCATLGSIKVTENCITTAGKLKCEGILHAVGPEWGTYEKKEECLRDLYFTVLNVFKEAETHKYRRVAMTPLSAGTYRVPSDLCADMHIKAVMVYAERRSSPTIHEIHILDSRVQMLNLLKDAHKKWLQNPESLNFDKAKKFNLFPDVETLSSRSSSVTLNFKD